jgi:hypothetical protein
VAKTPKHVDDLYEEAKAGSRKLTAFERRRVLAYLTELGEATKMSNVVLAKLFKVTETVIRQDKHRFLIEAGKELTPEAQVRIVASHLNDLEQLIITAKKGQQANESGTATTSRTSSSTASLRGGCLTTAGAAGSTSVVKGIWTATTAYVVGDIVVPHANMTGAGGKLLRCTTAGTSGSTNTLAVPNPGTTLSDGGDLDGDRDDAGASTLYVALLTAAPSDSGGGTEVTGGSYARVAVASALANWAGTQSAASTTASSGTGGQTSNNGSITFPSPTANWGVVTHFALYDALTGGNLIYWGTLTVSKTVNNGDAAPVFAAAALTITED